MSDGTYQSKVYRKQCGDELVVADGGKITVESGGEIEAKSGAIMSLPDIALEVGDLALASAKIIVGNGSGKAAAVDLSGDATISNAGAITVAAKAITLAKMNDMATASLIYRRTASTGVPEVNTLAQLKTDLALSGADLTDASITAAKLANGAGVSAILTAGLGGSQTVVKTDTATKTIVAAHGTKDRAVLVVAVVTEAFATGDTSRTLVSVGEDDTVTKLWGNSTFPNGLAIGTVLVGCFTNLATKKIIITSVAAVGTGTGGVAITAIAIPTT
jgi:hypothetical protein